MDKDYEIINRLSLEYKEAVGKPGPDGTPGLNDIYSAEDFRITIMSNLSEFKDYVIKHPFFKDKLYLCLEDVYNKDHVLLMYLFQTFFNEKKSQGNDNPPADDTKDEEKENKKQFIKEVMDGIERKKTLKEFLDDPRSYQQYRDDIQSCLLYTDWEKIHRAMKCLKWKWAKWVDEYGDVHHNTVPSVYGIRENVIDELKRMYEWIKEHPEADRYMAWTAGFEYEIRVCNPEDDSDPDDYEHRVRFIVRFVLEYYDNGM